MVYLFFHLELLPMNYNYLIARTPSPPNVAKLIRLGAKFLFVQMLHQCRDYLSGFEFRLFLNKLFSFCLILKGKINNCFLPVINDTGKRLVRGNKVSVNASIFIAAAIMRIIQYTIYNRSIMPANIYQ